MENSCSSNETILWDIYKTFKSYLFILFRVKLFSEMERGWEPSSLRSSKVGYKQFYFHYIILHYIFIIFISLQLCMQFQT